MPSIPWRGWPPCRVAPVVSWKKVFITRLLRLLSNCTSKISMVPLFPNVAISVRNIHYTCVSHGFKLLWKKTPQQDDTDKEQAAQHHDGQTPNRFRDSQRGEWCFGHRITYGHCGAVCKLRPIKVANVVSLLILAIHVTNYLDLTSNWSYWMYQYIS